MVARVIRAVPTAEAKVANLGLHKGYATYKPSGVEWLGEVPSHWEVRRLKYSAPIRVSKLNRKPEEVTYVGLEHIESSTGRLLLNNQPESVDSVVGAFGAGDVLFGKLRPYLAKSARPDCDRYSPYIIPFTNIVPRGAAPARSGHIRFSAGR